MARLSIGLLLVALACMHITEGRSFRKLFDQVWEEATYDNLVLVYTWAPSYCEKAPCTILNTAKKNWTIHGLWPYKNGVTNTPIDCTGTYAPKDVADLRDEMSMKWPSYKRGGTYDEFWGHEYTKHGTCASDMAKLNSAKKYFQTTMELYDKYNIKSILAGGDHRVGPSATLYYPLDYVTSALRKGLGVDPAVYCLPRKKFQYLWEVRMCFNKLLAPITCGANLAGGGKCLTSKKVKYPLFPAHVTGKSLATSDDLALRFLLDVAEMGDREMMKDEEEEEDAELWENFEDEETEEWEEEENDAGFLEKLMRVYESDPAPGRNRTVSTHLRDKEEEKWENEDNWEEEEEDELWENLREEEDDEWEEEQNEDGLFEKLMRVYESDPAPGRNRTVSTHLRDKEEEKWENEDDWEEEEEEDELWENLREEEDDEWEEEQNEDGFLEKLMKVYESDPAPGRNRTVSTHL